MATVVNGGLFQLQPSQGGQTFENEEGSGGESIYGPTFEDEAVLILSSDLLCFLHMMFDLCLFWYRTGVRIVLVRRGSSGSCVFLFGCTISDSLLELQTSSASALSWMDCHGWIRT